MKAICIKPAQDYFKRFRIYEFTRPHGYSYKLVKHMDRVDYIYSFGPVSFEKHFILLPPENSYV